MKAAALLSMILTLFLGACTVFQAAPADQAAPGSESSTPGITPALEFPTFPSPTALPDIPGISPGDVFNSEYQLGFPDQIRKVQLTDGQFKEGIPGSVDYISVNVTDFIARGDLNGDGENEAVAIAAENYGGSGTFVFLVVYQYQNEEAVYLTSIFLDDRPLINTLAVVDGEIFVDIVIHDSDDPMCCPTLATTRHYFLNGVNLILTDYSTLTPAGEPRVISIQAPVDGAQVSGIVRLLGEITIAPFEKDLVYRIYDLGGVELSAGPVSVESIGQGASGTFEKAIGLGNILTDTTIRIVVEDINAADGSLFAMDSVLLQVK
jgi:hypothetical protein